MRYLNEKFSASNTNFGIMVVVTKTLANKEVYKEFEKPSPLYSRRFHNFRMYTVMPCPQGKRKYCAEEFLYRMLRAKHTN